MTDGALDSPDFLTKLIDDIERSLEIVDRIEQGLGVMQRRERTATPSPPGAPLPG